MSSSLRKPSSPVSFFFSLLFIALVAGCSEPGLSAAAPDAKLVIAGAYIDASGLQRPCAWLSDFFVDLGASLPDGNQGGVVTSLTSVLASPLYSGYYVTAKGELRSFLLSDGRFTDIAGASPAPKTESALTSRSDLDMGTEGGGLRALATFQGRDYAAGFIYDAEYDQLPCYWEASALRRLDGSLPEGARGGVANAILFR